MSKSTTRRLIVQMAPMVTEWAQLFQKGEKRTDEEVIRFVEIDKKVDQISRRFNVNRLEILEELWILDGRERK